MVQKPTDTISPADLYKFAQKHLEDKADSLTSPLKQNGERYRFQQPIAEGGMKWVSCVYDQFLCRDIAMAKLRPNSRAALSYQFLNEARLTAQLDHPNIIKVHDMGTDQDGRPFFTMDLKTGQSLTQYLIELPPRNKSGLSPVIDIFMKVCEAIAYAHSMDIVHLDLKPGNIQVGEYGEVVVCDWGLGTSLKRLSMKDIEENPFYSQLLTSKPSENRITGTPGFMAPEQYDPDRPKDKRTDVYGLGALLFTLLTGEPPQPTHQNYAPPLTAPIETAQLPESLEAICLKALEHNPAHRYPSAQAIIEDLRLYQTGYTTSAEASGFVKELKRFLRRNRRLSIAIGSSALLLIISTALFLHHEIQSKQNELKSRLRAEASEQKTRQALRLYEEEKTALSDLNINYSSSLQSLAIIQNDLLFYQRPNEKTVRGIIATIDKIPRQDPLQTVQLHRKANMYFIMHDFSAALPLYQSIGKRGTDLAALCDQLIKTPRFQRPLSVNRFAELIQMIRLSNPQRKHLLLQILLYDAENRPDKLGYENVIQQAVHYYNPDWENPTFDYNPATQHLKIGGKNLTLLIHARPFHQQSLLANLPIKSLDVSNTELFSLTHLAGLENLEQLNISHTLITTPPSALKFPKLKTLIISEDQFTPPLNKKELDGINIQIQ